MNKTKKKQAPAHKRIKRHLEEKGIKVSWLSKKTKISNTELHFVLSGERELKSEYLVKINIALETTF